MVCLHIKSICKPLLWAAGTVTLCLAGVWSTNRVASAIQPSYTRHQCEWTQLPSLPQPSAGHASAFVEQALFVIGGGPASGSTTCDGLPLESPTSTVYRSLYSGNGQFAKWETLAQILPCPLSRAASVVAGDWIYLIGGWKGGGDVTADTYFSRYFPDGANLGDWQPTTSLPDFRTRHAAVSVQNWIYSIGGTDGVTCKREVFYTSVRDDGTLNDWQTTLPLPECRYYHAAIAYKSWIYVIGGAQGDICSPVAEETVYRGLIDPVTGKIVEWVSVRSLHDPTFLSAATILDNQIYVIGGYKDDGVTKGPSDKVYTAEIGENGALSEWQAEYDLTLEPARYRHTAILSRNYQIVVAGGIYAEFLDTVQRRPGIEFSPRLGTSPHPTKRIYADDVLTYTFYYENMGCVPVTGVALRNPIPEGTTLLPSSLEGPCVSEAKERLVVCRIGDVEPDTLGQVSYQVQVTAPLTDCLYTGAIQEEYDDTYVSYVLGTPWNFAWLNWVRLGGSHHAGFRFTDVDLPRDALLDTVDLRLCADGYSELPVTVTIYAEAPQSPTPVPDFRDTNPKVPDRPRTSISTTWYIVDPWQNGERVPLPAIENIVTEVLRSPNWESGGALAFLMLGGQGEHYRSVRAFRRAPATLEIYGRCPDHSAPITAAICNRVYVESPQICQIELVVCNNAYGVYLPMILKHR